MQVFTDLQYLKIDIANSFGLDKQNYDVRLNWFDETIPNIKEYNNNQLLKLTDGAEEPHLMLAGLIAYRSYLNNEPSGYRVAFDSCNSGCQIMSALTRDEDGLRMTGMIENKRYDFYTEVYKVFKERTNSSENIERKHLKKSVMTSFYGSKQKPKQVLGKHNYPIFVEIMEEMTEGAWTLRNLLIDEWNPNVSIQEWILPDGYNAYCPVEVEVEKTFIYQDIPINYKVKENKPSESGLSNAANVVHSVDGYIAREVIRRCKYDVHQLNYVLHLEYTLTNKLNQESIEPISIEERAKLGVLGELIHLYEETGILTVRIIEYITSIHHYFQLSLRHRQHLISVLLKMVQYKPFDIATIHDSFSVLPCNMNYVRYWYNDILANIVDSDVLQFLLNQVCLNPPALPRQLHERKILAEKVRNSNYGLT